MGSKFIIEHNSKSINRWWKDKHGWTEKEKATEYSEDDLPKDLNGIYFLEKITEDGIEKKRYNGPHSASASIREV